MQPYTHTEQISTKNCKLSLQLLFKLNLKNQFFFKKKIKLIGFELNIHVMFLNKNKFQEKKEEAKKKKKPSN